MKIRLFCCATVCLCLVARLVEAQPYPAIRLSEVHADVVHDTVSQMYYYSYLIHSDSANSGNIIEFEIDISRSPTSQNFDTTGLVFEDDFVLSDFRIEYPCLRGR